MDYNYPLLQKVFEHFGKNIPDTSTYYLVCCQHILEPQLKMFELLISSGFDPNKIILLGKAYSTNGDILKELKDKKIRVFQPPFLGGSFDDEHEKNCHNIVQSLPANAKNIIIDDGAELIKIFADNKKDVLFAVEQTSSGFRKLQNEHLPFPVVNVARSTTKLVQESPLVARVSFERIEDYLRQRKISKPSILVVGLGPVGEAVLEILKLKDFESRGFDIKHGHGDLLAFINKMKPDVVIGATGSSILEKESIDQLILNKPLYLISLSSSDREFPVASFRSTKNIHDDVVYKNITFVNNGFPITFKGNRYELAPIEIEKTICLLAGSVLYGLTHTFKKAGFVDVPLELEKLINA